jgi:uncharacterized protein (TIGR02594 family)
MSGYDEMKKLLGLHEVKDRKELMKYMAKYKMPIDPATTPWCAAIMNACERAAGKPGNGRYNARSFLTYGTEVKPKDVKKGDLVVFARGGSSWQGHIAYVDGIEADGTIRTLGGNQSDKVCISWYAKNRLLGFRRSP